VTITQSESWRRLAGHVGAIEGTHLRELMKDGKRCGALTAEHDGVFLDYSRQRVTAETMELLFALAREARLQEKVAAMFAGEHLNTTEDRAVMHVALRARRDETLTVDGRNVVPDVHAVLDRVRAFSDRVRSAKWKGASGEPLTDVVAIGIGGSYLGPEFVSEALRTDPACVRAAEGRRLRFLANVDPVDVARATEGLRPESTLVVVISKTFTTAETMLNARTLRAWIARKLGESAVAKHVIAVSTNLEEVARFGIDPENAFGFWDWVGGRYSVSSAVGVVPLALQYGFEPVERFLAGARSFDRHFLEADPRQNLPVILGLLGVWNSSFLRYGSRALLPYAQALLKLAPHIQQVDMESNGKRVTHEGEPLDFDAGEVDFGEPGTNGQHSFYQLIHQGRVVPCDFVGFAESQQPIALEGEPVSNHDELMANFFAQPDALAFGKTSDELRGEGVAEHLIAHRTFPGNRPSSSLLLPRLDAYTTGQLLSLYEHRTAVQGFVWGVNSFDQWGVELGKVLAKRVRHQLSTSRSTGAAPSGFNASTDALLRRYLATPSSR
jgi:glucose-6-phosphate isomerase